MLGTILTDDTAGTGGACVGVAAAVGGGAVVRTAVAVGAAESVGPVVAVGTGVAVAGLVAVGANVAAGNAVGIGFVNVGLRVEMGTGVEVGTKVADVPGREVGSTSGTAVAVALAPQAATSNNIAPHSAAKKLNLCTDSPYSSDVDRRLYHWRAAHTRHDALSVFPA